MSFYLTYRPQTVEELDLDSVRESISRILKQEKLPHAYLFAGPRGLGKTSSARIFTKAINCEQREQNLKKGKFEPCNKCSACLSVVKGNALDLIEIDAASNRGIDDIRELKDKINLSPTTFKYKVYVIDEVHMLTNEAFNALLKTIEEPPDHAIFILATTNPEKIPSTILSRTMRINFESPSREEILRAIKRVILAEKLDFTADAIDFLADNSENSFRDAHKLLEQLSFYKEKIDAEKVKTVLGLSSAFEINSFFKSLAEGNKKQSLSWIWKALSEGAPTAFIVREVIKGLREIVLSHHGLSGAEKIFNLDESFRLIDLFTSAFAIKDTPIESLPLEIAVLSYLKENSSSGKNSEPEGEQPDKNTLADLDKKTAKTVLSKTPKINPGLLISKWEDLLIALKPKNHSVSALLRSARPLSVDDDTVCIEVYYPFHKQKLETQKMYGLVQSAVAELFGTVYKIKYLLGKSKNSKINSFTAPEGDELLKAAEEVFET